MDSGASINIIKGNKINKEWPIEIVEKNFKMGNDLHSSNKLVKIKIRVKQYNFYVVPENFPIPEDGILGLPLMKNYKYSLTNDFLTLDGNIYKLIDSGIHIEADTVRRVKLPSKIKNGHIIIHDHTNIDDGIFLAKDYEVKIPIINSKNEPLIIDSNNINTLIPVRINYLEHQINKINNIELGKRIKLLQESTRLSHVENSIKENLEKIIYKYNDIFHLSGDELHCCKIMQHEIILKDQRPVNLKNHKLPECYKEEVNRQVKEQLKEGIIQDSNSPYNSPIWVVKKKLDASGKQKYRIVIDFRKLNEKTDQDSYPLPNIDEILDHLGKAKFFSALDLSKGFFQIPIHPDSRKYTAFSTQEGHFEHTERHLA